MTLAAARDRRKLMTPVATDATGANMLTELRATATAPARWRLFALCD
ncbi:MAG: hypothetical protein ABI551_27005 [Polyangiaceae bacterium]